MPDKPAAALHHTGSQQQNVQLGLKLVGIRMLSTKSWEQSASDPQDALIS